MITPTVPEKRLLAAMREAAPSTEIIPQLALRHPLSGEIWTRPDLYLPDQRLAIFVDGWECHMQRAVWKTDCYKRNLIALRAPMRHVVIPNDWTDDPGRLTRLAYYLVHNANDAPWRMDDVVVDDVIKVAA